MAVADLGIRPARVDHLMVSDVGAAGEGWPWIDDIPPTDQCDPRLGREGPMARKTTKAPGGWTRPRLPTFLHYCQR